VLENISKTSGTTVRARNITRIFGSKFDAFLVTRANSIDDVLMLSLGIEKESIKAVRPERTKLWNIKIIPIILSNRFHIVYCVADIFGFFTYYILSKFLKYKIIFEAHALKYKEVEQISRLKSVIFYLLEVFIGSKADAIIALSGITYSFYKKFNKNTFFCPVFVDFKQFEKEHKNKHVFGKLVGLIGPFDILSNKDQLDFLYANMDKFDKRIRFRIIGKCNKKLTNTRIEYTGYLKSEKEYVKAISELDALLVPARFATYGPKNKIIEAMACGVPVFATWNAIRGLDFAQNFKNIIVCEEDLLIDMINKYIFDEKYMKEISLNAWSTVKKYYSIDIYKNKIFYILYKILKKSSN
jgi:glycosyltransferase involved in cell wall biosynthesis